MNLVETFIEKGFAHRNALTGCIIWEGELSRSREPDLQGQKVRDRIWQTMQSDMATILPRNQKIDMICENDRCIAAEHMQVVARAAEVEATDEEITAVERLYFDDGMRLDGIATRLNTSRSRVSRILSIVKARREAKPE